MTLSTRGAKVAHRRAAFLLHRQMAHLRNRWRVVSEGGIPSRWPSKRPILESVLAARSLQPPNVSNTTGTNVTPTSWHEAAC